MQKERIVTIIDDKAIDWSYYAVIFVISIFTVVPVYAMLAMVLTSTPVNEHAAWMILLSAFVGSFAGFALLGDMTGWNRTKKERQIKVRL